MRFLLLVALLALPVLCSAEIYKWVDEKGQIGFVDDLGKVPAKYRDKAAVTEKQEPAVEIIEKVESEKAPKKETDAAPAKAEDKGKGKDKQLYGGKEATVWKQDFARQKHELKSLEDQTAGIKERMADGSKLSRQEYLSLQNTLRDLDVRIAKSRQKLDALTAAADSAELPAEFR